MYVCQINGNNPIDIIKEKSMLANEQILEKISQLIEKNLVNDDKTTLSEIGRDSLRIVLAGESLTLFIQDTYRH